MVYWIPALGILLLVVSRIACRDGLVKITNAPETQTITVGQNFNLTCNATGPSPPTIEWFKDGENMKKLIRSQKGSRIYIGDKTNTLFIKKASTQDRGNYTCRATQGAEVATKVAQVTIIDVPDPPINVKLTECENRIAEIHWTLVNENLSPVLQFVIEYNTSFSPHVWQRVRSGLPRFTTTSRIALSPWANYTFRVLAENSVGWSDPSAPTIHICRMPPDVPRNNPRQVCTLNDKPHTLVIAWQAMPLEEQNGPGFYYVVQWKRDEDKDAKRYELTVDASQNQVSLSGQPVYTLYEIHVYAVNSIGKASLSPKSFTGYSSEDVPKEVVQEFRLHPDKAITNTTVDVVWNAANKASWRMCGFLIGYKIEYWKARDGPSSKESIKLEEMSEMPNQCWRFGINALKGRKKRSPIATWTQKRLHIYNLWPDTDIEAQIRVMNVKYDGPPSKVLKFRTMEGVPGPVHTLKIDERDSSKCKVTWSKPRQPNGVITGYVIHYRVILPQIGDMKKTSISDPDLTNKYLTHLESNSEYQVFIWAETKIGLGEPVEIHCETLPADPPIAPTLKFTNDSKRSVNVTWFPSLTGNPGTVFILEYRKQNTLSWVQKQPDNPLQHWMLIEGLEQATVYEIRVTAKNGNTWDSKQTSSPLYNYVLPGLKRELLSVSFHADTSHWEEERVIMVWLDQPKVEEVTTFYVKYRPKGAEQWQSLSDNPADKPAIMTSLKQGVVYEICVVATHSQSVEPIESSLQTFRPGYEVQASPHAHSPNASSSLTNCLTTHTTLFWTILLLQILTGYL